LSVFIEGDLMPCFLSCLKKTARRSELLRETNEPNGPTNDPVCVIWFSAIARRSVFDKIGKA